MADNIILRNVKGSPLTYVEADTNFSSYFYSASVSGTEFVLHYPTSPYNTTGLTLSYDIPSFPFTGSAEITGSLELTGSFSVKGLVEQTGLGGSTYFGYGAGISDLLANNYNTAFGYQALTKVSTGNYNIGIGAQTARNITTGESNIAVGYRALDLTTTGTSNIGVGSNALEVLTTGTNNIGLGTGAASKVTIGDGNITVGKNTLLGVTTGDNNVVVGDTAAVNLINNSTGNVVIGSSAGPSVAIEQSNKLYIANSQGKPLIGGDFADEYVTVNGKLEVSGSLFVTSSEVYMKGLSSSLQPYLIGYDTGSGKFTYFSTGSFSGFPYTGSARITGSLDTTGSVKFTGSLDVVGLSSFSQTSSFNGSIKGEGKTELSGALYVTSSEVYIHKLSSSLQPYLIGYDTGSGKLTFFSTGSFSGFPYTGSARITGSLDTTGSVKFTGSLDVVGLSSFSQTASFDGSIKGIGKTELTGALYITSSELYYKGLSGSNQSFALAYDTASGKLTYMSTASFIVDPFPYTGSARITGSLDVTGSTRFSGSLQVTGSTYLRGLVYQTGLGGSTYFGDQAGASDDRAGNQNTGVGERALTAVTTGFENTAIGNYAAWKINTGNDNTALGFQTLQSTTNGTNNTAVGARSIFTNNGADNTGVGYAALLTLANGSGNTALGSNAGRYANGGSTRNLFIGKDAGPASGQAGVYTRKLYIADTAGTPLIGGDFASQYVTIDGSTHFTGALHVTSSDFFYPGLSASNQAYALSFDTASGKITYMSTASFIVNPFPYTGSARITGSLDVTGSVDFTGSLVVSGTISSNRDVFARQRFIGGTSVSTGLLSSVAGGSNNNITGNYSFIGGGQNNTNSGGTAVIGGGNNNSITGTGGVITGGGSNTVVGERPFIGGGSTNTASGSYAIVVGGFNNVVAQNYGGILGGQNNTVNHTGSFIIGSGLISSEPNATFVNHLIAQYDVQGLRAEIGDTHTHSGVRSAIIGGVTNNNSGTNSVIIGGVSSTVSGENAVSIGSGNHITYNNTIAIGQGLKTHTANSVYLGKDIYITGSITQGSGSSSVLDTVKLVTVPTGKTIVQELQSNYYSGFEVLYTAISASNLKTGKLLGTLYNNTASFTEYSNGGEFGSPDIYLEVSGSTGGYSLYSTGSGTYQIKYKLTQI